MPGADAPDQSAAAVLDPEAAAVLRVGAELLQQRVRACQPELAPAVVTRLLVEVKGSQHRPRRAVEQLVRRLRAFAATSWNRRSSFSGVGSSFHETSSTPTSPCIRPGGTACAGLRPVAGEKPAFADVVTPAVRVPSGFLRLRSRTSRRARLPRRRVDAAARSRPARSAAAVSEAIRSATSFTRAASHGLVVPGLVHGGIEEVHHRERTPTGSAAHRPSASRNSGVRSSSFCIRSRSFARSVTGPRRTLPPVV